MCSSMLVVCHVKSNISGTNVKREFTATVTDGSGFRDWKLFRRWADEESLCFVFVYFQFVLKHPRLNV